VASHDEIAPFQSTATTSRNGYPTQSGRPAHSGVPGFRSSPVGLPCRHDDRTNARQARRDSLLDNYQALRAHLAEIRAGRIVLTHMSGAITRLADADLPAAYDGMTADL
jgi:hypothetical protein